MKRSILFGALGACLALLALEAKAQAPSGRTLGNVKDALITRLLNESEQIADLPGPAYASRIFLLPERGECASPNIACPKQRLFLAVSELSEYPDQKVYRSEKAHQWTFIGWRSVPQRDGPDQYLAAEFLKKTYGPGDIGRAEKVVFKFNLHHGIVNSTPVQ